MGKGFDVATLTIIAGSFFDDPDVADDLKADLRNRLGLVETMKKSIGRIPADPRDLKRQLKERGTRTIRREVKRPDGTTEIIEETERILEPIVYSNDGMPIEFRPSPTNETEWQVSAWRPSGPPLEFTIGTQEMTRGLSSLNWLLATQALEAAGFTYPFGGGIASEENRAYGTRLHHLQLRPGALAGARPDVDACQHPQDAASDAIPAHPRRLGTERREHGLESQRTAPRPVFGREHQVGFTSIAVPPHPPGRRTRHNRRTGVREPAGNYGRGKVWGGS